LNDGWSGYILWSTLLILLQPAFNDVEINRKTLDKPRKIVAGRLKRGELDQILGHRGLLLGKCTVRTITNMRFEKASMRILWPGWGTSNTPCSQNPPDWQNPKFITDRRKTRVVQRFPHTFVRYLQGGRLTFLRPKKLSTIWFCHWENRMEFQELASSKIDTQNSLSFKYLI